MPPKKKPVDKNIYEVTCSGQYYSLADGDKKIKTYAITAKMDGLAKAAGFLSVFRNEILGKPKVMMQRYPDWKKYRTHTIDKVVNLSDQGKPVRDINLMTRKELITWVNSTGLEIDTDLYQEVQDLRQAIRDYRADYESFKKQQDKRRLTKGPQIQVQNSLKNLNPWLEETESTLPVSPTPVVQPENFNEPPLPPLDSTGIYEDEPIVIDEYNLEDELAAMVDDL